MLRTRCIPDNSNPHAVRHTFITIRLPITSAYSRAVSRANTRISDLQSGIKTIVTFRARKENQHPKQNECQKKLKGHNQWFTQNENQTTL